MKKIFSIFFIFTMSSVFLLCQTDNSDVKAEGPAGAKEAAKAAPVKNEKTGHPLITFIELGSVNCIPCQKMQPVMRAIEDKYGEQIDVVFYDVWKPDQHHYAQKFGIRLIPTQVFLDKDGKEIFRHEGFFPENEIDVFLQESGLKPKTES
jgi:thioredoxin 1